ncbi:MAG: AzlD domain-containing protein [Thermaerobacter sp.]|nr:AzlD domain-containing protein [Thermaerobacter sp.]
MSGARLLLLVFGAALGTALLRYLPAFFADRPAHRHLERLLQGVPAAALGALLVQSAPTALPPGHLLTTIAALSVAIVLSLRPGGVLWPVAGAVAVAAFGLFLHLP